VPIVRAFATKSDLQLLTERLETVATQSDLRELAIRGEAFAMQKSLIELYARVDTRRRMRIW